MIEELPYSVFDAGCQTITNTVNCQGVMGAGLALEFKLRYPDVFEEYAARCKAKAVRPGEPYVYRRPIGPQVLHFPTKNAWRFPSKMEWIRDGLDRIAANYDSWGIESLALARLGSSHGGLAWEEVRAETVRRLDPLPLRVVLCLDQEPHPEGLESQMLATLNRGDTATLEKLGLAPAAAARVAEAAPFRRVRDVIEIKGVGKSTYERLFEAFRAPSSQAARQSKLDFS